MSGGYWNYDQDRVRDLGERMLEHGDPLIAAVGQRLIDLAAVVRDIDWFLSSDSSSWDRVRATRLLGPAAEVDVARARAIEARQQLDEAIARSKPDSALARRNIDAEG